MIKIKLFGIPEIVNNDEVVAIPFKKAEAVLYYLLVKKTATRDEIINLLWGEASEDVARKNLRNAIYRVKKALDADIITSPQKNNLIINPDIQLELDYDNLFDESFDITEITREEFLKGFYVKNEDYFEKWVYETNEACHRQKVKRLRKNAQEISTVSTEKSIEIYEMLLEMDKLDEEAYEAIIKLSVAEGKLQKAKQTYQRLKDILDEELGIEPDKKLLEYLSEVVSERKVKHEEESDDKVIGRREEITFIEGQIDRYIAGMAYENIVVRGDAGIGKTTLVSEVIKRSSEKELFFIKTSCFQVDKDFYLKPWSEVFREILSGLKARETISREFLEPVANIFPGVMAGFEFAEKTGLRSGSQNLDNNTVEEILRYLIDRLLKYKKVVILFEDIHWMDRQSMSLLSKLITGFNSKILTISTYRTSQFGSVRELVNLMKESGRSGEIRLKEFSEDETVEFVNSYYKGKKMDEKIVDMIYKESEGVPFFVKEYINMINEDGDIKGIPTKIAGLLEGRFNDISKQAKQVSNIASVFSRKIDFETLVLASGKSEFEVMDSIEELKGKWILKDDEISMDCLVFSHMKIKDFIYESMSFSMKKLIHKKIASVLENESLERGGADLGELYSDLIYHLGKADEDIKKLDYKLKYIQLFLDYSHELYPILKNGAKLENNKILLEKDDVLYEFDQITDEIERIKEVYGVEKIKKYIARFHYIKGRYLIREGEYDEGAEDIKFQIDLCEGERSGEALKGYKQLIYMSIQTHDVPNMKLYLDEAFKIQKWEDDFVEDGILTRLLGLYYIMIGDYKSGEDTLNRAISVFESDRLNRDKYVLNIAACYNYIGEINRREEKYEDSIGNYKKAIELCEKYNLTGGLPIFYTNMGQAAFEMNDYSVSKDYFLKAIDMYETTGIHWNRAIAEVYLSLIYLKDKKFKLAYDYLQKGDKLGLKIRNPYDLGLINYGKFLIWNDINQDEELMRSFKDIISPDGHKYLDKAIDAFEKAMARFEIDRLRKLTDEN